MQNGVAAVYVYQAHTVFITICLFVEDSIWLGLTSTRVPVIWKQIGTINESKNILEVCFKTFWFRQWRLNIQSEVLRWLQ